MPYFPAAFLERVNEIELQAKNVLLGETGGTPLNQNPFRTVDW